MREGGRGRERKRDRELAEDYTWWLLGTRPSDPQAGGASGKSVPLLPGPVSSSVNDN